MSRSVSKPGTASRATGCRRPDSRDTHHARTAGGDPWQGTFDELYDACAPKVLSYAARRTDSMDDAEEAAAETFVIAWRRLGDCPAAPLLWLYGIARRVLANRRRGASRWRGLRERLFHTLERDGQQPLTMSVGRRRGHVQGQHAVPRRRVPTRSGSPPPGRPAEPTRPREARSSWWGSAHPAGRARPSSLGMCRLHAALHADAAATWQRVMSN